MNNITEMLVAYDMAKNNGFYGVAQLLLETIAEEKEMRNFNSIVGNVIFKTNRNSIPYPLVRN